MWQKMGKICDLSGIRFSSTIVNTYSNLMKINAIHENNRFLRFLIVIFRQYDVFLSNWLRKVQFRKKKMLGTKIREHAIFVGTQVPD